MVPVRSLFETHLTVRDLDRSIAFYRDVLGLPLVAAIAMMVHFWRVRKDGFSGNL